jgi:cell division protein FtsB
MGEIAGTGGRGRRHPQKNGNGLMPKQNLMVTFAVIVLFILLLLILFGDKGLADLNMLKKNRDRIVAKNDRLMRENLFLYRAIGRLKTDPVYIENIAREELGVVGENELIIKLSGRR